MAISQSTIFEVRPTNGVDTNGGGFVSGASGTDYSQQNAAQYALTGLTTSGASATILTASASTDMVGNLIQITSGTNFTTGFYQILSVVAGVSITVDRNATSGVGASGVGNIGGALKTIGKANGAMQAGNVCYVKAEATITTASTITINFAATGTGQTQGFIGYTSSRTDGGQVTIQASTGLGSTDIVNLNAQGLYFANFVADGNSQTNTRGLTTGSRAIVINVTVKNTTNNHAFQLNQSMAIRCVATNHTDSAAFQFIAACVCINCIAYANTCSGFQTSGTNNLVFIGCIAGNNTGAASDGFVIDPSQGFASIRSCTAYKNGRDGFHCSESGNQFTLWVENNISYGNSRYGFFANTTPLAGILLGDNNAYGANTTADLNGFPAGPHDVTLTGNPTTAGDTNNFTLNNTAGAGAACRAAAFPGVLLAGGTGYLDIGALQHQEVASGGVKLSSGFTGGFRG